MQRSRCDSGAVPQLGCLPKSRDTVRTSQVACPLPSNSALGGRAVRAAPPPDHLPPLIKRRFFMVIRPLAGMAVLAALVLAAWAAAVQRSTPAHIISLS